MKNYFKNLFWVVILFAACTKEDQNGIDYLYGSGEIVSKTIKTSNFDIIDLRMRADVYLQQGASTEVRVEGQQNLIENLSIHTTYGPLVIEEKQEVAVYENFKIYITAPNIKQLINSNFGKILSVDNTLQAKNLALRISYGGSIQLNTVADNIAVAQGKQSSLKLTGSANTLNVIIRDCERLNAFDLKAKKAKVNLLGSAEVNVSDSLIVEGRGTVYYKGHPVIISLSSTDDLTVVDANN